MKYIYTTTIFCALSIVLLNACNYINKERQVEYPTGWTAVYKHDEYGTSLEGNIDTLISAIRSGYDLHVGWGFEKELSDTLLRLEHIAKPVFITIIQEKYVSVVIDPHPLLSSYYDISNQSIADGGHTWQCVLTTKGEFNAQIHHRSSGELIKDWRQRQRMTWFVNYPVNKKSKREPLFN